MRKLSAFNKGWVCAAIDGEGSFRIQKLPNRITKRGYSYSPQLIMDNTDLAFIEKWRVILGEEQRQIDIRPGKGIRNLFIDLLLIQRLLENSYLK